VAVTISSIPYAGRQARLAVVNDITARKRAEELLKLLTATLERRVTERTQELTAANQRLQAIMDSALVGILTLDERGRIESANPAAGQTFGYAPKEMLGLNIGRLMASPTQAQHEDFLAHCLLKQDTGFMSVTGEVLGRRQDGKGIMLELTLTRFAHGARPLFLAMMRNITERKRLERELLEVSERERRQLGHDLHDGLGQHLHGLAYLAAALQNLLQEQTSPCAAEAGRLNKYLAEALEMTRNLARGLQPVDPVPQGLMRALRELAERTRGIYQVDCRFECRPPVLIHRHTAANHLYRIAQEAVNNAMKHAKPTRLRLQLKATPARIILGVRDNGVGIRRHRQSGRGMGLHVMQHRADAIGGSLLVQRLPQGGTEVVCTVSRQALLPQENNLK
jgi:two-component system, LuxR family, sensor kinase FixL